MIGFLFRRFRWMLVGAGVKFVARRGTGRAIDEAANEIEQRLPAPVVKAANALPGDIVKAGGAAVVSARAAQKSARVAKSGSMVAARFTRAGVQAGTHAASLRPRPAVAERLRAARLSVADQAELDRRELKADFLRYSGDEVGAVDALLDVRDSGPRQPLPEVPDPVPGGRRRFVARRPAPEGNLACSAAIAGQPRRGTAHSAPRGHAPSNR